MKDDLISEKTKVINDARDKAIVSVRQYAKPKIVSAMFELLISIVAIMGVQLMTFGFNLEALRHWNYWVRVGCCTIAIFLLYRAVINARYYKTSTRQSVCDVRDRYNELNKEKDLAMKDWLKNVFNLQTKVETYIDKINRKIDRCENRLMNCYNGKRKEKLETKLTSLQALITQEYISIHIQSIRIKYYKVYFSDFQSEDTFGGNGDVYTRGNYGGAFNKASFKKMWMYVLSSSLLGISVFSMGNLTAVSVMTSIVSTAMMVITRIVTALLEADQLYDKTTTRSLNGRIEVLQEYIAYKKEHPTMLKIEQMKKDADAEAEAKWKEFYQTKLKEDMEAYRQELKASIVTYREEKEA